MSQDDLFDDFPNAKDGRGEVTLRELFILIRQQNEKLTEVKQAIKDQAADHKAFREDIHKLIASREKDHVDTTTRVDRLETKLGMFKTLMGVFGAVAIITASCFGFFIKSTLEQQSKDHDKLTATAKQLELLSEEFQKGR